MISPLRAVSVKLRGRRLALRLESPRSVAVRLFLTCWFLYALHFATNTVREIYPALSLGDHLSFDVSEYLGFHPDMFEIPGRGAFINNNPGASILGAIPYALARPVIDLAVNSVQKGRLESGAVAPTYDTIYPLSQEFYRKAFERGLDLKFALGAAVMQAFLMAPLSALTVVGMFAVLLTLLGSKEKALLLSLLFGFGTPVFYRTAQLNQNLLIGDFTFLAFLLLWRPWDRHSVSIRAYLLAGLLAGWTVVLDYSGIVAMTALGLYALFRWAPLPRSERPVSALIGFGLGALISLCVLWGYQYAAFGNPFLPAQHYMPATIYSGYGINGMGWPQLDLLWASTFGHQYGLYLSAPILLLTLFPAGWLNPAVRLVGKREALFILLFSAGLIVFSSGNQYGRLQFNSGVRYLVPVSPFLFLIAAGVLLRLPRVWAAAFAAIGTYWSWCLAMYRDVEQAEGVFDSLIHISLGGPRLPWLTTLEKLGMVSPGLAPVILLFAALVVLAFWTADAPAIWPSLRRSQIAKAS